LLLLLLLLLGKWDLCMLSRIHTVPTETGQNVTLQCRGPPDPAMVKWVRPDLERDGYVLYVQGRIRPSYHHEAYKNRVEPLDPPMKNGVYSVVLMNVSSSDNGTYKCVIGMQGQEPTEQKVHLQVSGELLPLYSSLTPCSNEATTTGNRSASIP
uniref:Ig-like domain-containing protein n=1 Tax=Sphaeramia orbicularis TaxID=375764 RepID=A0A672YFA6_9TELE